MVKNIPKTNKLKNQTENHILPGKRSLCVESHVNKADDDKMSP